ncbi:DgyrCDS5146 [Dimorphilus gyrociliatus]|uniref:DgyrCDS5146 n=1 Tax=Dimorphilus gyrociliatus TaxID=2664684 RepID=A0A7I8VIY7_9ANNE|nr:DgyrCDS5146 [Dimorphilus gyrociliatus]
MMDILWSTFLNGTNAAIPFYLALGMIFLAPIVYLRLVYVQNAPYGRYDVPSTFKINVKLAWFVQELPAFLIPVLLYMFTNSPKADQPINLILLGMFMLHYAQRTFVYPFLIRGGKPSAAYVVVAAFAFCVINGYMQGFYLLKVGNYPSDWLNSPKFMLGSTLFLFGFVMNLHSDHILRNLRKPGETGYKIPQGGLFEYFTCGNLWSEFVCISYVQIDFRCTIKFHIFKTDTD